MFYFAHRILGTQKYKETEIARINSLLMDEEQKKININRLIDETGTFKVLQRCAAITAGGAYLGTHIFGQIMYGLCDPDNAAQIKLWYNFVNGNNDKLGYIALAAFGLYLSGGVKGLLANYKAAK